MKKDAIFSSICKSTLKGTAMKKIYFLTCGLVLCFFSHSDCGGRRHDDDDHDHHHEHGEHHEEHGNQGYYEHEHERHEGHEHHGDHHEHHEHDGRHH